MLSLSIFSQPPHSLSLFSFHLSSLCSHSFCLVLSWKIEEHEWTADASCLERCLGLMQCVMCINSLHPLHPHPPHYLSHFAHSWSVIVSLFWLAIFFFYMKPLRSSSLHNFFGHQIPSLVLFHRLEWSIIPISCFSSRKLKVYFVKSIIRYFYSTRDCSRTSEVTLKSKNFFKRILENKYWKVKYIVYNGDSPSSSTSYASEGS